MGNCASSPQSHLSQPTRKRTTNTVKQSKPINKPLKAQTVKPSKAHTSNTKTPGKVLSDNNLDNEIDLRKAAGDAAMKRLDDKRSKDGKLGKNLQNQRIKSTQKILNDSIQ